MSCNQPKEVLASYAAGLLSPAEREIVGKHLLFCSPCQAVLSDFETMHQAIASEPNRSPDPVFINSLQWQLRKKTNSIQLPVRTRREGRVFEWAALVGLIVFALVGLAMTTKIWTPNFGGLRASVASIFNIDIWMWTLLSILAVLSLWYAASTFDALGGFQWAKSKRRAQ